MAVSLIQNGKIKTTLPKAKELRKIADQLVTLGKKDSLHARRLAFSRLRDRDSVVKLFGEIAPAFKGRNGGYTRIYKMMPRRGDGAEMALIEYLSEEMQVAATEKPATEEKAPAKKKAAPKEATKKAAAPKKKAAKKAAPKKAAKAKKADKA